MNVPTSMRILAIGLSLAVFTTGCGARKDGTDVTVSAKQNKATKPEVAIVPIFDRTENNDVSWNLSDELTTVLSRKLAQKEQLHIANNQKVRGAAKKLSGSFDPFAPNIAWAKNIFTGNDFVVFMELLKHEQIFNSPLSPEHSAADLNISLKLRVVDLRGDQPKIVLQEIIHDTQHLPKQFTKANFRQVAWGEDDFHVSPVGLAHVKLIKELSQRIEDYILLAAGH